MDKIEVCKCLECRVLLRDSGGNKGGLLLPNKAFPKRIEAVTASGCPHCESWEGIVECTELIKIRRYKKELAIKEAKLSYPEAVYFKSEGPYNYLFAN